MDLIIPASLAIIFSKDYQPYGSKRSLLQSELQIKYWKFWGEKKIGYMGAKVSNRKSARKKGEKVPNNILLKMFTNIVNRHNNKCKNRNMHCIGTASIIQMPQSSLLRKRGIFTIG